MSLSISKSSEGKVNIVFSASSFNLFETCACKYNYSHNMRKTLPMVQRNKSLDYGTLIHVGMERYFLGLQAGEVFSVRSDAALMKIREVASDPAASNLDISEDLDKILSAVETNLSFWRADDEQMEVLAVEAPFDYVLFEDEFIRIIISGKIDLLVNYEGLGGRASYKNLPIDHKSFSRDGIVSSLDNQFKNYCAVTESNYLWVNRIGLTQKSPEEKFKRLPLSYTPQIISDWKKNITHKILNDYLTCVKTGIWPMNETNCTKFSRLCEFSEVCESSGQDAKDYKIHQLFLDKEAWDKYEVGD